MEAKLVEQNEFTKTFNLTSDVSGECKLFVSKAFDEEDDAHYLVMSIPELPKLGIAQIQYPIKFDSEILRDGAFDNEVNESWACAILPQLESSIVENNNQRKADAEAKELDDENVTPIIEIGSRNK